MLSTTRLCIQSPSMHGQTVSSQVLQAALTSTSLQDSAMMAICTLFRAKPSISLFRRTGTWPTCSDRDHACKQFLIATIVAAYLFPFGIMRQNAKYPARGIWAALLPCGKPDLFNFILISLKESIEWLIIFQFNILICCITDIYIPAVKADLEKPWTLLASWTTKPRF